VPIQEIYLEKEALAVSVPTALWFAFNALMAAQGAKDTYTHGKKALGHFAKGETKKGFASGGRAALEGLLTGAATAMGSGALRSIGKGLQRGPQAAKLYKAMRAARAGKAGVQAQKLRHLARAASSANRGTKSHIVGTTLANIGGKIQRTPGLKTLSYLERKHGLKMGAGFMGGMYGLDKVSPAGAAAGGAAGLAHHITKGEPSGSPGNYRKTWGAWKDQAIKNAQRGKGLTSKARRAEYGALRSAAQKGLLNQWTLAQRKAAGSFLKTYK